jgi:hypothetical protein
MDPAETLWRSLNEDSPCPSDFASTLEKYNEGSLPSHFYWDYLLGLFGEERAVELLRSLFTLIPDAELRKELTMASLLDTVLMDFGGDEDDVHEFESHLKLFLDGQEETDAFWTFAIEKLERPRLVELLPWMELIPGNNGSSFTKSFSIFEGIFLFTMTCCFTC